MKTKICYKCKKRKSASEFYVYKSGKNEGHLHSYCKFCANHLTLSPWQRIAQSISSRCNNKNGRYYKKGIKKRITPQELKILWCRDKASLLKKASIDRIDATKDYTFENCRFIELSENQEQGRITQWRTKYPVPIQKGREKAYRREYMRYYRRNKAKESAK